MRVLVVDNSDYDHSYLTALAEAGYEILRARDGADALVQARSLTPDIILADLPMPVMDGYTLLRRCKADALLRHVPFILYSAICADPDDERLARDLGADAVIAKPVPHETLLTVVRGVQATAARPQLSPKASADKLAARIRGLEHDNRRLEADIAVRTESLKSQRAILDALPAEVALIDTSGVIVAVNEAWSQFGVEHGFQAPNNGVGANYLSVCDNAHGKLGAEGKAVCEGLRAILSGKSRAFAVEYPCHSPTQERWFRLNAAPLCEDGVVGAVVMHIDITEMKLAQVASAVATERLQLAAHAAALGIWEWRPADSSQTWNDRMREIYGIPIDEPITYESWTSRVHPDDVNMRTDVSLSNIAARGSPGYREYRIVLTDGQVRHIRAAETLLRGSDGKTLAIIGINIDITEQKEREDRLFEQSALLDSIKDAILVHDVDHKLIYWNRAAESIYEWRRDQIAGLRLDELLAPSDLDAVKTATRIVLETGQWSGRLKKTSKAGRAFIVESSWTLLRDHEGKNSRILVVDIDLTDRLNLERRLEQAQKLEAVGQLTGGIAHDFNNLLTVILGSADLLANELAQQPSLKNLASMTRTAAERGAQLTSRLLSFSRKQPLDPKTVDINQLVEGMDPLLRRTLGEHIEIDTICGAGLWKAMIDATQLESALLNLCINARDAMPNGGRITIETANVTLDAAYVAQQAELTAGEYVMIAVSDNGCGMDDDVLARVFEPFFTTKEVGQGSGLGLSMVYGFTKQSKGHIRIYSEVGHGTTVKLFLPRSEESAALHVPQDTTLELPRGVERILVVEDDALVRAHVTGLLTGLGYDVVGVANGAEALDELHGLLGFDLLFTDIVMPGGMNGRDLARRATEIRPNLPVLFTSGYAEQALSRQGRLDHGVQVLTKPYHRQDLAVKIRAILDAH